MPKPGSVTVTVRYNGYEHKCVGAKGDCSESTQVHIFTSQLPKGYRAEHGYEQFDLVFKTHCLELDSSGESEWVTTEVLDLDARARK